MSLRLDDGAESRIIGVGLLTLIGGVMAGVVLVLVDALDGVAEPAPFVGGQAQDGAVHIVRVEGADLTWDEVEVVGCSDVPEAGPVFAGDRLEGCAGPVTIRHESSGTVVWSAHVAGAAGT